MNRLAAILIALLFIVTLAHAHDEKVEIIVDTDGGIDDLRALTMLLSSEHLEIIAISTSDGVCKADLAALKVKQLLTELGRTDIPLLIGTNLPAESPAFGIAARELDWGSDEISTNIVEMDAEHLTKLLESRDPESLTIVSLGPLSTTAKILSMNSLNSCYKNVLWYGDIDIAESFNASRDSASIAKVVELADSILCFDGQPARYPLTTAFFEQVADIYNPFAQVIAKTHAYGVLPQMISSGHFGAWDELLPLWLEAPQLFMLSDSHQYEKVQYAKVMKPEKVQNGLLRILRNAGGRRASVVFEVFPFESSFYNEDLRSNVDALIHNHGKEEFRFVVMTCELHRHLGLYSIVGAKMGLKAREILGAQLDQVEIYSFAGNQPPFSCLNDGLQISTGATLGQGLIQVSPELQGISATFDFKGTKLRLQLKPEYLQWVKAQIKGAIAEHGNLTPAYWRKVRQLAIQCWLEWDRHEIFVEVKE